MYDTYSKKDALHDLRQIDAQLTEMIENAENLKAADCVKNTVYDMALEAKSAIRTAMVAIWLQRIADACPEKIIRGGVNG